MIPPSGNSFVHSTNMRFLTTFVRHYGRHWWSEGVGGADGGHPLGKKSMMLQGLNSPLSAPERGGHDGVEDLSVRGQI